MNFKKYHVSKNLFDKSTVVDGYGVDNNSGNLFRSATLSASDYINISGESYIRATYITSGVTNQYGAFYDNNKTYISGYSGYSNAIAVPQNAVYTRITARTEYIDEFMLNTGSTPQPYEPYSSEVWHDIPHYIHNTSTDTITTPAVLYPNDTTATVGLKGNMSQTGTPTPSSPITPSETGERTGNLLSEKYENRSINGVGAFTIDSYYDLWIGEVVAGQTYTISNMDYVYGFFTTKPMPNTGTTYDGTRGYEFSGTAVVTVPSGCKWIAVRVLHNADNAMLNTGSTALPYEPYGYKIPILSNSTTTPVYLGEVQSTRWIKKLVLTGNEDISEISGVYYSIREVSNVRVWAQCICSHCEYGGIIGGNTGSSLWIKKEKFTDYPTITDFKSYLQQQYAAGTPVTVWYVLATPETAVVNEPLRKIGLYADEVSGITIPTIAGTNAVDVLTTLKPSEVSVNYKGWHPVQSVHEAENGQWD